MTYISVFLTNHLELCLSVLAATIGLLVWLLILLSSRRLKHHPVRVRLTLRKPLYIQTVLALVLHVYWGLYWDEVGQHAPLVVVQLVFAYLFEMCLSWSRGKVWQLGLGQFPVVLSINFFLWFRDEYFYLQLLLIALTYLTKEFVTWERGGRRTHIFNPSAISLALLSILLLSTDSVGLTNGIELTMSFSLPPSFFEVIFLLGLITQFLFRTTLVTFGSSAALCILYFLSQVFLGTTFNPTPIDIVVFLGLTFLVTDPSTSPKTETGKFLFGMTYGTGILIAFVFLQYHRQPAHFDKILVVPIVNLLVKFFNSCAHRLVNSRLMKWIPEIRYGSAVTLGLYICFFVAIAESLKQSVSDFAGPLPESNIPLSPQMVQRRAQHMACRQAYPKSYRPFGFGSEFVNFRRIRKFVPQTDLENDSLGEALRRLGEWDGADMYFRQALAINPSYAPAHLHMGISLIEQNKVSEAITHIRQSLEGMVQSNFPQVPRWRDFWDAGGTDFLDFCQGSAQSYKSETLRRQAHRSWTDAPG